jgi:hypothetical protein
MAQVPGEKVVPQVVKDKFASDFSDASIKRWQKKGRDFIAHMTHENKNAHVRFTKEGRIRWINHSWKGGDLPAKIVDPILKEFPGFTANWANENENPNLNKHHFYVRLSKPGFVLKVLMNSDGTFAKENNDELNKEK